MAVRDGSQIDFGAVFQGVNVVLRAADQSPIAYDMGHAQGLLDSPAPVAPVIAIVSPDPDDPVGAGGFPDDVEAARLTPIVVDVTSAGDFDTFAVVVVRYPGESIERVAYRRGTFRRGFSINSSATDLGGGVLRLSILPDGGWPDSGDPDDVVIDIDGVAGTLSDIGASS